LNQETKIKIKIALDIISMVMVIYGLVELRKYIELAENCCYNYQKICKVEVPEDVLERIGSFVFNESQQVENYSENQTDKFNPEVLEEQP